MRRIIVKLVAFLLLGMAVNVTVAVACAIYPAGWFDWNGDGYLPPSRLYLRMYGALTTIHFEPGRIELSQKSPFILGFGGLVGVEQVSESDFNAMLPYWSAFRDGEPALRNAETAEWLLIYSEVGTGWPIYAFRGSTAIGPRPDETFSVGILTIPEFHKPINTTVPYHVIPVGFAINTLFYTGMIWLLFIVPIALRRRRRVRRGLCPACAYPVGASAVCTECGRPVTHRTSEAST